MSASAIKAGEAFVKIWANDADAQKTLTNLQVKMKQIASEVSSFGAKISAIGAGIVAPFTQSTTVFAGFADKMSTVKAVTGATEAEFQKLTDKAKELGEKTSFTAQEAANGLVALGRAGYTANEAIAAIPDTLDLARAGALDLGVATTIMADTSRSFGFAADEAQRVADVLAKTANVSNTDITGIGEAMKYVASSAKMTGQSLEGTSAAIAVLANRGIKGEMAGTALAKMLVQLANTNVQDKLKKQFDIDTTDAQGNLRDMMAVMSDIDKASRNMGNAEKLAMFQGLFDMRGMKGGAILSENIAEWAALTETMRNANGTAAQIAAEMDNNLGGSFRLMMSAIEGVQIALGAATEGTLREWMAQIQNTAGSITEFVKNNEQLVVGVGKIGVVLAAGGAAVVVFAKAFGLAASAIPVFNRVVTGLKSLHDQATGTAQAEKAYTEAESKAKTAADEHAKSLKQVVTAQEKYDTALQKSATAGQAAIKAKTDLQLAQQKYAAAIFKENQTIAASEIALGKVRAAEEKAEQARYEAWLTRSAARKIPDANKLASADASQHKLDNAEADVKAAQANYEAEIKKVTTAQKEKMTTLQGVSQAQDNLTQAENRSSQAATRAAQAGQNLRNANNQAAQASQNLTAAQNNLATAAQRSSQALRLASSNVAKLGSPKVMAASGTVAAVAGSISALAGDSDLGKIAGMTASVAGIGMAASAAVNGVMALQNALPGMSTGAAVASKALAGLAVAVIGWQVGRSARHWITGFDEGAIADKAKKEAAEIKEASESNVEAMMKINAKIIDLRHKESEMGWDFGFFRLAGDDCAALNTEIDALEKELANLEEAEKSAGREAEKAAKQAAKATEEAAKTEKIEAYEKAVEKLADAWQSVVKKIEDVNKARASRKEDQDFTSLTDSDAYAAQDHADNQLSQAEKNEADLLQKLRALESERNALLKAAEPNTDAVNALETQITATLKDYETAVERTDTWERFYERADSAVTKIRDDFQKLADEAKKLDLDFTAKQDDQRFKDLLKTDWKSAADEVAAAMTRVNAEWIQTGKDVAKLIAQADKGDVAAQERLATTLNKRKDLASKRSDLESRQNSVDSTQKELANSGIKMQQIFSGEEKHEKKEAWNKVADSNPNEANSAISEFIASLKQQLQNTATNHQTALLTGDLTKASAYEEQAKVITDKLSELRGLDGQREERNSVTGEFNARAMEAMMRGGQVSNIPQKQLDKLTEVKGVLDKLLQAYEIPSIYATE